MTKETNPEISPVFRFIHASHEDAKQAKRGRMDANKDNWDVYHLRQDWSHKQKGMSKEFLPKQALATEQITSFLQQGVMDIGEWYRIEREAGYTAEEALMTPEEIQKLLGRQLEKNVFPAFVSDSFKSGLLGSLMIAKVGGVFVDQIRYEVSDVRNSFGFRTNKKKLEKVTKKVWQLKLGLVRQEDYYPDPTGNGLYEQEEIEIDYYELVEIAKKYPDEFNLDVIQSLQDNRDWEQEHRKARETDQKVTNPSGRKRIRFIEHWGTICDPDTGEVLYENCVARYTKDGREISPPQKNKLWHGESPYVVSPIIRVPFSVWHRALMDAPSQLNRAQNELFNLEFDSGMMAVFGIRQMREDWLDNPAEVSDGVSPGQTLKVNSSCPPGGKVLERIDTGSLSTEAANMFNMVDREFQSASLSSDIRMGNLPQRAVKSTEIVAANQAITGTFNGIVKVIEELYIGKILYKSWVTCAQHMNDIDSEEVKALLGADRANQLSMVSPEERFAKTALGHKYKVFGLSLTLNKIQDFKKIATLLQTIGSSEILLNEFLRKYSLSSLMGEIVKALDIDEAKIVAKPEEQAARAKEQQAQMAMQMMGAVKGGNKRSVEQGANAQSQIPQMNNQPEETGMEPGNPANDSGLTAALGGA